MKTKEKIKERFLPEAEGEEKAPAVNDLGLESEQEPDDSAEMSDPIKDEETKDNIEPGPLWSGARDLEVGKEEVAAELEEIEIQSLDEFGTN